MKSRINCNEIASLLMDNMQLSIQDEHKQRIQDYRQFLNDDTISYDEKFAHVIYQLLTSPKPAYQGFSGAKLCQLAIIDAKENYRQYFKFDSDLANALAIFSNIFRMVKSEWRTPDIINEINEHNYLAGIYNLLNGAGDFNRYSLKYFLIRAILLRGGFAEGIKDLDNNIDRINIQSVLKNFQMLIKNDNGGVEKIDYAEIHFKAL
jgi:hypothetical protein